MDPEVVAAAEAAMASLLAEEEEEADKKAVKKQKKKKMKKQEAKLSRAANKVCLSFSWLKGLGISWVWLPFVII